MTTQATPVTTSALGGAAAGVTEATGAAIAADSKNTATPDVKADPAATAAGTSDTPEAKAATEKAAAEKSAAELAAKPFTDVAQLKLADGLKVDEAAMKEFLPLAGKLGLTAAQAQALVEFSAKSNGAAQSARAAAQESAQKAAVEALKGDKDIGGANWDKSMKLAGQVLAKFGGPELSQALNEIQLADGSMLGDSVVVARLLVSIGKSMAEDTLGSAHSNGKKTAANDAATFHKTLYPNTPQLT